MASATPYLCDICHNQRKSVPAEIWCLVCEESLCDDCCKHHAISKVTRSHDTLSIAEYNKLPDSIIKVGKVCSKHSEQFSVFCNRHACLGCRACALEDHKLCPNVSRIEDVVGNVKSSSAFNETIDILSDISKNIDMLITERQNNVESLQEQKRQIEKDIANLRAKINEHLDKIQIEIIDNLSKEEKRERKKIDSVLKLLSGKKSEIQILQEDIINVRKHASDLHAFLAMRETEKYSDKAHKKILDMKESGDFNIATLIHKVQTQMSDLASVHFGEIATDVSPSSIKLITRKDKQAQLPVAILPSLESVSVRLNRTINTGCVSTRGCVMLPDGKSLLACYINNTITCFDKDGNREYIKQLDPVGAFDIAYFEEINKILISSGKGKIQQFNELNLSNMNTKPHESDTMNYGVVIKQNKLIYCAKNKGICERNLSDGSKRVIVSDSSLPGSYITEYHDRLYYTNNSDNSVTCCGMDGRQIWKFTNDALKNPLGVSVDNNGNVYVVGYTSTNVVVISADGQRHKEIISTKDGLLYPQVLYYQNSTNKLLVANGGTKAFLFDVSFNV